MSVKNKCVNCGYDQARFHIGRVNGEIRLLVECSECEDVDDISLETGVDLLGEEKVERLVEMADIQNHPVYEMF